MEPCYVITIKITRFSSNVKSTITTNLQSDNASLIQPIKKHLSTGYVTSNQLEDYRILPIAFLSVQDKKKTKKKRKMGKYYPKFTSHAF